MSFYLYLFVLGFSMACMIGKLFDQEFVPALVWGAVAFFCMAALDRKLQEDNDKDADD